MNKELLQQKAAEVFPYDFNTFNPDMISVLRSSQDEKRKIWLAGAKEILDNTELYEWVSKDLYYKLYEELEACVLESIDNKKLEKENKELKDKVTELEVVIAKLSQKVILYESNY